jgi:predicted GIY-YIG superfamily endonuclease
MLVKIYKIINSVDDRVYIGSTIQPLYKRWNEHKKRYRKKETTQYSSSILFNDYGYDNCKMILENEIEVNDKFERNKIEREYIDKYKNCCVNLHMPFKTEDELKQDIKAYSLNAKDKRTKRDAIRLEKVCCDICSKQV